MDYSFLILDIHAYPIRQLHMVLPIGSPLCQLDGKVFLLFFFRYVRYLIAFWLLRLQSFPKISFILSNFLSIFFIPAERHVSPATAFTNKTFTKRNFQYILIIITLEDTAIAHIYNRL
jgi:ABC-type uncharacterized transport system permease subunit